MSVSDYFKRLGSPVAAIATATGGPLAVIRISGNLQRLLPDFDISEKQDRNIWYRNIFGIDHGLVLNFKAPNSFTGEDVIELQVHGSGRICESILGELKKRNIIEALPGEFSFRAFMNKKMSLAEAEALHVGLTSASEAQITTELVNLSQATQEETKKIFSELEASLTSARGRLESAIDFSEAVEEQRGDVGTCEKKLQELSLRLDMFLTNYENFSSTRSTPKVLIVGEPNSGKSSLLNLLLGSERSLVSNIPGTTRDYIEAHVKIKNQKITFIDSAGIRELEGQNIDTIEKRGIDRALALIKDAHAILWVCDSRNEPNKNLKKILDSHDSVVRIESFGDISKAPTALNLLSDSAKLRQKIEQEVLPLISEKQEAPMQYFLSDRQVYLLKNVEDHVKNSILNLQKDRPMEIVAEDLKLADSALKKCVGRELSNDYISEIFSQFCLGK